METSNVLLLVQKEVLARAHRGCLGELYTGIERGGAVRFVMKLKSKGSGCYPEKNKRRMKRNVLSNAEGRKAERKQAFSSTK